MKVIVAGSRDASPDAVRQALAVCPWSSLISVVLSGTAPGADQEGERWAEERKLLVERYPADWKTFGKRAGPLRNKQMAENADGLVAIWDGQSRGTLNMIDLARKRGLRVFVYRIDGVQPDDISPHGEVAARWASGEDRGNSGGLEHSEAPPPIPRPLKASPAGEDRRSARRQEPRSSACYRLNTLLASPAEGATIVVGREPYQDHDHLDALRDRLRETHLVKRSREGIETVAYAADGEVVGDRDIVRLGARPDLAQSLLREWLARSLAKYRPRRGRGGTIQYVSERPDSNLLLMSLPPNMRLPDGVGRRIAADFDVRRIRGASGHTRLAIVIDMRTRLTLDCPVADLLAIGVDPLGLYVRYERLTPRGRERHLAGRVRAIEGDTLVLDDHVPDVPRLPARSAWLEPRKENFEAVVEAIAGPQVDKILEDLHTRVAKRLGGRARLALVDEWVRAIRRFPDEIAQGVRVRFDRAVMHADGGHFPNYELYSRPRLVFDVGRTKTEIWNQGGLDKHGPYNFERFTPRRLNIALICQASRQGDVERFTQQLLDGIPGSKYAENGFVRRYHLDRPNIRTFTSRSPAARHYREAVAAAIDDSTTRNERWNLALIQTDEAFHALRGDDNPYLLTKALFLSQQVPTQAFEWESIRPGVRLDATVNNIGLAVYAKVNGIPWLLPIHQTVAHELVVGIGSFEASESRLGGRERYIGVTTVFSADGRYMLESRTPATPADDYLPALLSALERVVGEVRRGQGWSEDQPVRLIFHVFKDFNQTEIQAVKQLMMRLQLPHAEFAFIHVVEAHPYMLFDPAEEGVGTRTRKGVATAPRGLRVDLANNEALICLKGARELRQWSDGIPKPVLLRLHRDSTFRDLSYLARQVFDFTCLSWRTLAPSSLPISVVYSDLVARNLLQLRDVTIWSPETILGPVGRSRWFL